jgi:predicted nucleic acid-binding protein
MADSASCHWDSCIFIDGLRQTAGRFPQISALEQEAKGGHLIIFTSTLAIAEVCKTKDYGDLTEDEHRQIKAYFRHKFVKVIQVDRIIARNAAEIVRDHSLKPPDAIHVATAIRCRCQVLYTYDGLMLSKDGQIGTPALPIKPPGAFGNIQSPLFQPQTSP